MARRYADEQLTVGDLAAASRAVAPVASAGRMAPGLLWGFLGDSITNGASASNFAYSYAPKAIAMVGAMVARRDSIEAGVPGERSDQTLARLPALLALGIQGLVVLDGTNDAGNGVSVATYAANKIAQIKKAKRRGLPVVLCTVPPQGSGVAAATHRLIQGYNAWIKLFGPIYGCEVADVFAALANTSSGAMASGYDSGDGVHPNDLGHATMAVPIAKAMRRAANWRDGTGLVTGGSSAATANLIADPLNTQRASVTTSPWFEFAGGTGTAPVYSFVSDTTGVLPAGRWAQMDFDATASGGTRRLCVNSTDIAVGDVIAGAAHIQIEDVEGGWFASAATGASQVSFDMSNGGTGVQVPNSQALAFNPGIPRADNAAIYDIGPILFPVTVPSGLSNVVLRMNVTLATGRHVKARLGGVGLLHLTRMGIDGILNWGTAMVNT